MKKTILIIISLSLFSIIGCAKIDKAKAVYEKGKVVYPHLENAWNKGKDFYSKHCNKAELETTRLEKRLCKKLNDIKNKLGK